MAEGRRRLAPGRRSVDRVRKTMSDLRGAQRKSKSGPTLRSRRRKRS